MSATGPRGSWLPAVRADMHEGFVINVRVPPEAMAALLQPRRSRLGDRVVLRARFAEGHGHAVADRRGLVNPLMR